MAETYCTVASTSSVSIVSSCSIQCRHNGDEMTGECSVDINTSVA